MHAPPVLPSVTSIPNFGYRYHNPGFNGNYRHQRYSGLGYGYGYAMPYYYYPDDSAYGYEYMGNGSPELNSGPPPGANDNTLHIVVEQPPSRTYREPAPEEQAYAPPVEKPAPPEIKPGEPVVLVFRNGHQQQVTNYAIMGDALYVFDDGRKKIALADLDIPATVKANDERGVEFRMPPASKKKAAAPVPQSGSPEQKPSADTPPNVAAVMP